MAASAHSLEEVLSRLRSANRLSPATLAADAKADQPDDQAEYERRLAFWCEHAFRGNQVKFQRRLDWDDLTPERLRQILLAGHEMAPDTLPSWVLTLEQIMSAAQELAAGPPHSLLQPAAPVPFQELCLPAVAIAQQQLRAQFATAEALLSPAAWATFYQQLLEAIAEVAMPTFMHLFTQRREADSPLKVFFLTHITKQPGDRLYQQFVAQHLADGMRSLFEEYSVLGRLMATLVERWVATTGELLTRLHRDWALIEREFSPEPTLGQVVAIAPGLSDPHDQGRTVAILTFDTGLRLVYKPKPLGLAVAFNRLLDWCNGQGHLLPLAYPAILDRTDYGWVEYVERRPCASTAAVERFYRRQGMLMCLVDILEGNDFHFENILASGEYPMLIDLETLLVPPMDHKEVDQDNVYQVVTQRLTRSVLRTALLPGRSLRLNRSPLLIDVSGLGLGEEQSATTLTWRNVNTDGMTLSATPTTATLTLKLNLPLLGATPVYPDRFTAAVEAGFVQMYETLMAQRDFLVTADSPLQQFRGQISRLICRNTAVYFNVLRQSYASTFMGAGVARSMSFDVLDRAFVGSATKPALWSLGRAEKQALEQLDIPSFTGNTVDRHLYANGTVLIPDYFPYSSFQAVMDRVSALSPADLDLQVQVIRLSLYSRFQQEPRLETLEETSQGATATGLPDPAAARSASTNGPSDRCLESAIAIGQQLHQAATWSQDGAAAAWIGIDHHPYSQSFHVNIADFSLYAGAGGIGLFFAALAHLTDAAIWRRTALAAVAPVRQPLQQEPTDYWRQAMARSALGGADKLPSLIYALSRMGQLLQDQTLIDDAYRIAAAITPAQLTTEQQLDVVGGTAGNLLHLLALLPALTGEQRDWVLTLAMTCGEHLLAHQSGPAAGPKAWATWRGQRLTGYAQGAAGIADALLRLFAVTQDHRFRAAAAEAIAYEQTQFSPEVGNWRDLRSPTPAYQISWGHGAAGIALGRLSGLSELDTEDVRQQLAIALDTTQSGLVWGPDSLCWGTLGRVDILLEAARILQREDLLITARQATEQVLNRAAAVGDFTLFQNFPANVTYPGFFQGRAGIGYELLRVAHPTRLPSVLRWG